jgi:hypothetical protein
MPKGKRGASVWVRGCVRECAKRGRAAASRRAAGERESAEWVCEGMRVWVKARSAFQLFSFQHFSFSLPRGRRVYPLYPHTPTPTHPHPHTPTPTHSPPPLPKTGQKNI